MEIRNIANHAFKAVICCTLLISSPSPSPLALLVLPRTLISSSGNLIADVLVLNLVAVMMITNVMTMVMRRKKNRRKKKMMLKVRMRSMMMRTMMVTIW